MAFANLGSLKLLKNGVQVGPNFSTYDDLLTFGMDYYGANGANGGTGYTVRFPDKEVDFADMASRLIRNIPLLFPAVFSIVPSASFAANGSAIRSGALSVSGSASVSAVGSSVSGAWSAISSPPVFTFGTPSSWSFETYDPPGATAFQLASGSAALPSGVTLDSANKELDYSGGGSVGVTSGIILEDIQNAEADWQSRIGGSSVVWYHDFRNANEANNFRWCNGYSSGNDPLGVANNGESLGANVRRITTDGIVPGSGCLEILHNTGSRDGHHWWRPLCPFNSGGNGRTSNDPAASNTITKRTWAPTDGGNQTSQWNFGWYGNPNNGGQPKDGHDFYIQVRVKMDPRRIQGNGTSHTVGKFIWTTICQFSLSDGEHVTYSYGDGGNQGSGKNYLRIYATNVPGQGYFDPLNPPNDIQPGGVSPNFFYSGGWDTLLYHIRPGQNGVTSGANATLLEIWAAKPGETAYTQIWNQTYGITWENGGGPQALMFSTFNNGNNFNTEFFHRYGQVIFSKATIPIPNDPVQRGEV